MPKPTPPATHSAGKRRGSGRPDWVKPRLLLVISVVLVAVTTVFVAVRSGNRGAPNNERERAAAAADTTRHEPPATVSRPAPRRSGAAATVRAPLVSGKPDRDEAAIFHANFAERLRPRLRTMGFRPGLVTDAKVRRSDVDRWDIRVPSNFPALRVNAAITFLTRELGGSVYRAEQDSLDLALVRLFLGAGNVLTDEIRLRTDKRLAFKGEIAFVIDDVGYRPVSGTMSFVQLPYALTLAVLPHHEPGVEIARRAIAAGKRVILHLPMEPNGTYRNLEPNTLLTTMTDDDIRKYTIDHIESVPGISGVNNHMGSRATEDEHLIRIVLGVLKKRHLFFLDSRTTANTVAERVAREMGVRTGSRKVFLDNDRATPKVIEQILRVAGIASREGKVIAIGHDRDETYEALAQTLPRLEAEGFRICFLSDLLR